jgi:hypothetical protein
MGILNENLLLSLFIPFSKMTLFLIFVTNASPLPTRARHTLCTTLTEEHFSVRIFEFPVSV